VPFAAQDLADLIHCGKHLDDRSRLPDAETVRSWLMKRFLRIRDKQGQLIGLQPNAAQQQFDEECSRNNVVLKARQLGVTTWVAARFFVATITRPGTTTVQVAHDQRSAEAIFRIVHRFLENLPKRWRAGALATVRCNVRQIVFSQLDSEYRVESAADSEAGRGLTIHNLHCSELARWPGDAAATLAALRAAVPPTGEVVLESTPNGASGCFYDEWQRAPETGTSQHFFPWWLDPGYSLPASALPGTTEEREFVHRHRLNAGQIAFRRHILQQFGRLAPQEFAEDAEGCFLASGECIFDPAFLRAQLQRSPPSLESRQDGRLLIWWPAQKAIAERAPRYLIGVDPAGGGTGGDYSSAQVVEISTGIQCAELRAHLAPRELAREVARLAREYGDALVAVERNNHGWGVLTCLTANEHYENLYGTGGQLGWLTSAATRPRALEAFAAVLAIQPEVFSSERLMRECLTFVRRRDGTGGAAPGAHDDCLMAMAIALAVRGEVLSGVFRIQNTAFASLSRLPGAE